MCVCVCVATWNIANTYQIDNQGANIGIYVAVLILGITVNACGLKFNAWLNRVMSKWVVVVVGKEGRKQGSDVLVQLDG